MPKKKLKKKKKVKPNVSQVVVNGKKRKSKIQAKKMEREKTPEEKDYEEDFEDYEDDFEDIELGHEEKERSMNEVHENNDDVIHFNPTHARFRSKNTIEQNPLSLGEFVCLCLDEKERSKMFLRDFLVNQHRYKLQQFPRLHVDKFNQETQIDQGACFDKAVDFLCGEITSRESFDKNEENSMAGFNHLYLEMLEYERRTNPGASYTVHCSNLVHDMFSYELNQTLYLAVLVEQNGLNCLIYRALTGEILATFDLQDSFLNEFHTWFSQPNVLISSKTTHLQLTYLDRLRLRKRSSINPELPIHEMHKLPTKRLSNVVYLTLLPLENDSGSKSFCIAVQQRLNVVILNIEKNETVKELDYVDMFERNVEIVTATKATKYGSRLLIGLSSGNIALISCENEKILLNLDLAYIVEIPTLKILQIGIIPSSMTAVVSFQTFAGERIGVIDLTKQTLVELLTVDHDNILSLRSFNKNHHVCRAPCLLLISKSQRKTLKNKCKSMKLFRVFNDVLCTVDLDDVIHVIC